MASAGKGVLFSFGRRGQPWRRGSVLRGRTTGPVARFAVRDPVVGFGDGREDELLLVVGAVVRVRSARRATVRISLARPGIARGSSWVRMVKGCASSPLSTNGVSPQPDEACRGCCRCRGPDQRRQ